MGFPVYKSTSTPPDETPNPTPPPAPESSIPRSVPRSSQSSPRARTRRRLRHRRRAHLSSIPTEFLANSYNTTSRTPASSAAPSKSQKLVLVLTPDTTSNRPKGSYKMSFTTYSNKMNFSIPPALFVNFSSPSRPNLTFDQLNSATHDDVPIEDPGFVSDNESTTSEDSILSDLEWISSNRQLAMELLLGSSEDEFLGSLLGPESHDELPDTMDNDVIIHEGTEMDVDMGEADDEDDGDDEMESQDDNTRTSSRYSLRQVDEDYYDL